MVSRADDDVTDLREGLSNGSRSAQQQGGCTVRGLARIAAPATPPHNIELEQALLGAILVNNEAFYRVSDFLEPQHFFHPLHQKLYEIAASLVRVGKTATPITMKTFLPDDIGIAGLTAAQYLARLAAEATTVINAADYAENIRALAVRRDLISLGEDMVNAAYDCAVDAPVQDQIEQAERRLFELSLGTRSTTSRPASAVVDSVVDHFTRIMTGENGPRLLKTPFIDLNRRIGGGFRRKNLVVAAGRPGMGKTMMAAHMARLMAQSGIGVLFISLEMSNDEIGVRLLADYAWSADASISADKILCGDLTSVEAERLVLAAREYKDLPLTIDTAGYLMVAEIASRARAKKLALARRGESLDLLVIDYLKFVRPTAHYRGQRHYEIGEITAALRSLAKDLDLCVLLLAQLNGRGSPICVRAAISRPMLTSCCFCFERPITLKTTRGRQRTLHFKSAWMTSETPSKSSSLKTAWIPLGRSKCSAIREAAQ
jgi:replicative DNA helicase